MPADAAPGPVREAQTDTTPSPDEAPVSRAPAEAIDAPKDRHLFALLALLMAGLATLFTYWAQGNYVDHVRYSERYGDFDQWPQSPGRFNFLRLKQTSSGRNIGFSVDCEYRYEVGGKAYVGHDYSLQFNKPSLGADQAKALVESALGISGQARWRAIRYPHVAWHLDEGTLDGWELDVDGLSLRVRHSSRDPSASSLTDVPPLEPWVDWIFIVLQSVLAIASALGCIFMTLASLAPSGKPPAAPQP